MNRNNSEEYIFCNECGWSGAFEDAERKVIINGEWVEVYECQYCGERIDEE